MDFFGFHFIIVFLAISLIFVWSKSSVRAKRNYFKGLEWWSIAIPMMATFTYIFILSANLLGIGPQVISLQSSLHPVEMVILLTVSALFFSRFSSFVGLGNAIYFFVIRILFVNVLTPEANLEELYFLLSLNILIGLLGNRLPWSHSRAREHVRKLQGIKELSAVIVSLTAICILIVALSKTMEFRYWLSQLDLVHLNQQAFGLMILFIIGGWICAGLNLGRTYLIPLLTLPTLAALAFVSGTGYPALMPFLAILVALFLATAEKRRYS